MSDGERVVLIIHPYETTLNGEIESVKLLAIKAQILETVMLSEEALSISQIAEVLWGYNAEEMSESYIPKTIRAIRSDIKIATGIDGKDFSKP